MYDELSRRRFILVGSSGLLLSATGCRSTAPQSCSGIGGTIDDALCRQQSQYEDAPLRLTAAMIIGATLGAGLALAFRFDPVVGAIGGAMTAGGVVAVDTYVQYLKEQNNNDQAQMNAMARNHLKIDIGHSKTNKDDAVIVFKTAKAAFKANDGLLIQHAQNIKKSDRTLDYVSKNTNCLKKACHIYEGAREKDIVLTDKISFEQLTELKYHIDEVEAEERRFFAMSG